MNELSSQKFPNRQRLSKVIPKNAAVFFSAMKTILNYRLVSTNKTYVIGQRLTIGNFTMGVLYSVKVTVYFSISDDCITGPYFRAKNTGADVIITLNRYVEMLRSIFEPNLNNIRDYQDEEI